MKILWVSNIIFPEPAARIGLAAPVLGGWLLAMASQFAGSEDMLAVASLYDGRSMIKLESGNKSYYLLPGLKCRNRYDARLKRIWSEVVTDYKPDIIHIHGTEYAHALPLLEVARGIPAIVSIQGLIGRYAKEYYGGLGLGEVLRYRTLRDMVRRAGMLEEQRQFMRQGEIEKNILCSVGHAIGRTAWDRANTLAINPSLQYHECNESLRESFFRREWSLDSCQKHTIFVSQASYPLKGLHLLLEAIRIIRDEFPDTRLIVSGRDITNVSTWKDRLKRTGYGAYIASLIRAYGLTGNVRFTGMLDADSMAAQLVSAHLFVLPSAIENSPNSLGEAQLVGTPCIASYVGGVPDMVTEGINGLMYNYLEPAILANKIRRIFTDDELARRLSVSGRESARARHDPIQNFETLKGIYREVVSGGGKQIGER